MSLDNAQIPKPPHPDTNSTAVKELSRSLDGMMMGNGVQFRMDGAWLDLFSQALLNSRAGFVYNREAKRWEPNQ